MSPFSEHVWKALQETGEFALNSPIELMRFTLIYDGPLPCQGKQDARVTEKHAIRRVLHAQLRELWETSPILNGEMKAWRSLAPDVRQVFENSKGGMISSLLLMCPPAHTLIQSFTRGAYTFIPLVTDRHHLLCELDVLFLRAEPPGKLFATNQAGDLDNRIKVLFDALRMPSCDAELPKDARPDGGEEPMFCVLENDNLITALRVESERLLDVAPGSTRVRLVINVSVKAAMLTVANMGIAG